MPCIAPLPNVHPEARNGLPAVPPSHRSHARFTYLLSLVSPGGARRNRVLNKSDLLDLEIPAPDIARQKDIAELLDTAEDAIAVTQRYRDALNRQKRGLMQKLLTGKWQVNTRG